MPADLNSESSADQSVTVGQLAQRIDVAPRDVLDAAIAVGVRPFWHEGQQFRDAAYLRTYLRLQFHYDPVREVEFNLTPELAGRLAEELSVTPEEMLTESEEAPGSYMAGERAGKSPRKFVASQSRLPDQAASGKRREQSG
ncbi:MAG: hypothetical protein L0211_14450 [Planctomycetaceae bacterium]|nr:hypothetical protein [Planctomycetaceae bacterium]